MARPRHPDKNSVALAGEFAVLSQLAIRNLNPSLTLGHTKGIDILVSDPHSRRMRRLEVKTSYSTRKRPDKSSKIFGRFHAQWIMNKKSEKHSDDDLFYCFVRYEVTKFQYEFFVVPNKVVAKYLRAEHRFWRNKTKGKKTDLRTFRIGLNDTQDPIKTPKRKDFENRWDLLR